MKLSEAKLFLKRCSKCGEFHIVKEFNKDASNKYGLKSSCKKWQRELDKERYLKQKGSYIYIIMVDNKVWYVGSTNNIMHRINKHRNDEGNGHFIHMCKERGIDLRNKIIEIWVCDTEKSGYNLTDKDRKYYEHMLIRKYRELGQPLLNRIENSKFIERDRHIDEIPLEGFKFEKSDIKLI